MSSNHNNSDSFSPLNNSKLKHGRIADRLKAFEKNNKDEKQSQAIPKTPRKNPLISPTRQRNKVLAISPGKNKNGNGNSQSPRQRKIATNSANYLLCNASDSSLTVPEIVDHFEDQIELNLALAQEAAEKAARRKRYTASRRRKHRRGTARNHTKTANTTPSPMAKRKKKREQHHYSLLTKDAQPTGGATGVVMASKPSFKVDPKTYKAPNNLVKPTEPQRKLLLQALADNVLFSKSQHQNDHDHDDNDKSGTNSWKRTNRTPPQLKEALLRAFEYVTIKKGETVEQALLANGSQHHDSNCLYVIEEGEMELNDDNGRVVATATAGDTIGDLHTILQPQLLSGKVQAKRKQMRAAKDSKVFRLSHSDYQGIMQSQAQQTDLNKLEALKKLPFLNKLLLARDTDYVKRSKDTGRKTTALDAIDRITSIMAPIHFEKGQAIPYNHGDTLYVVKEGNVKLTSDQNKQYILGEGNHIGRKALMGSQGNEPTVSKLEALTDGTAYAIEKQVADKVLGTNFVSRETLRLDDIHKLSNFHCIKSANLNQDTLEILVGMIQDRVYPPGSTIMSQGELVEPCLFLSRQGKITLSSNDLSFSHDVKAGGAFGVEQLLMPKDDQTGEEIRPNKDTRLPAQWNVHVTSLDESCVLGVLSLIDCQEILDNGGKAKIEHHEDFLKQVVPKKQSSQHIEIQKQTIRDLVKTNVKLEDLDMISVIGEGAFGQVWKVETDLNGKKEEFALKKVSKQPDILEALKREIIFLTKFGVHPNCVSLIKVFDDVDHRYMLMNLASGGELWDVVHREESDGTWSSGIPEENAKFYAFLLADTLAFIHSKKYVYRDMKAENVLIDGDGYPILCDFGFAKYCPDKTYTCCGTPNYVAPEIITNEGHNMAVDWWALGVLIYEMVTGEHPFFVDGMDQVEVFGAIIHEQHPPMSPKLASSPLSNLVDGLLVKAQSQRLGMLSGQSNDIMEHEAFKHFDIKDMRARKEIAPWIPPKSD